MSSTIHLYSYQQILDLKNNAVLPEGFDLSEFTVEYETRLANNLTKQRRASHATTKPKVHKPKPRVSVDESGWSTVVVDPIEGEHEETVVETSPATNGFEEKSNKKKKNAKNVIKARPNNKNLGSSKAADGKDIQEGMKKAFNAFDALALEDDE
ncbi:uncharacterized protein HGUI_02957 [Hanseniaspora guilliermondii]|uniref:Cap-associated protein CAF20 n=1 Tax=Hanseniaspora guilliermondii TaxID=56406 RepID=A0A1L0CP98_9ASCO|nr:uncharacterized protein HGUI_02957 [Hanseniaspora guilliermondii]